MESITIKVENKMAKEIQKALKHNYATKTEFIRDAIRSKLDEVKKKEALDLLRKNFGFIKDRTSLEDDEKTRELVSRELMKRYGLE